MASPRKKASKSTTKAAPAGQKEKAPVQKPAPAAPSKKGAAPAPTAPPKKSAAPSPAARSKKGAAPSPAAPKVAAKKNGAAKAKADDATKKPASKGGKPEAKAAGRSKPPPPMKKADLAWLAETRVALTSQRDKLLSIVQSTQAQMAGKAGSPVDVSDMASEGFEDELAVGLMAMEAAQLDDIEAAIRRIDAGAYGVCEACNKPIPRKRLEILPFARRCVGCEGQSQRGGYR